MDNYIKECISIIMCVCVCVCVCVACDHKMLGLIIGWNFVQNKRLNAGGMMHFQTQLFQ